MPVSLYKNIGKQNPENENQRFISSSKISFSDTIGNCVREFININIIPDEGRQNVEKGTITSPNAMFKIDFRFKDYLKDSTLKWGIWRRFKKEIPKLVDITKIEVGIHFIPEAKYSNNTIYARFKFNETKGSSAEACVMKPFLSIGSNMTYEIANMYIDIESLEQNIKNFTSLKKNPACSDKNGQFYSEDLNNNQSNDHINVFGDSFNLCKDLLNTRYIKISIIKSSELYYINSVRTNRPLGNLIWSPEYANPSKKTQKTGKSTYAFKTTRETSLHNSEIYLQWFRITEVIS
jgi:hypothetical protein